MFHCCILERNCSVLKQGTLHQSFICFCPSHCFWSILPLTDKILFTDIFADSHNFHMCSNLQIKLQFWGFIADSHISTRLRWQCFVMLQDSYYMLRRLKGKTNHSVYFFSRDCADILHVRKALHRVIHPPTMDIHGASE